MSAALRSPLRVALVGNYPPRKCGIATFTADVERALADLPGVETFVVAMDDGSGLSYAGPVRHVLPQHDRAAYARLGAKLANEADVILLQHEYGIFGGNAGDYLLDLLSAADLPLIATLHTILQEPDADQRRVLSSISRRAERLVSMSDKGRQMLRELYNVPAERIAVIPHGVPDRPYRTPSDMRAELGWEERPTLLTFGLLSPNKGLELMLDALPPLVRRAPDLRYIILGVTHPHLVLHEGGEHYRAGLQKRAARLGIADHVDFVGRFMELGDLCDWLQAADIYVTPYRDEAQITSGTLAYAHAMGKPIVSTPYWHAAELLANRPGQLVPFGDPQALTRAVGRFLDQPAAREAAAQTAYRRSRPHIWRQIGARYLRELQGARRRLMDSELRFTSRADRAPGAVAAEIHPNSPSAAALAPLRALRHRLPNEGALSVRKKLPVAAPTRSPSSKTAANSSGIAAATKFEG